MESIYLVSLIVGGFFVLLSIFGGTESDADSDADFDTGFDADTDTDFDFDHDVDFDVDHDLDHGVDHDYSISADGAPSVGLVDLFTLRALFLFAAFFGLTGEVLTLAGGMEPGTGILAGLTGLVVGLGGNYIIKRFAYEQVSSNVTEDNMRGKTGRVLLPFGPSDKGKILIEARGKRIQLIARSIDSDDEEAFEKGEEVVVVRIEGRVAEVVKPT